VDRDALKPIAEETVTMDNERTEKQNQQGPDHVKLSAAKYLGVTVLNGLITVMEVAGGIMSGSLALLSDAAHNLGDTVSILLSYVAWKIAGKEKDVRRTYGYKRAEIIAAFVNASALVAISLFLVVEALRRFRNPETIDSGLMIGVALFGLAVNFISMRLLKRVAHGNMNVRSSYLHLLGDTVSSVGVLGGGIAIRIWGLFWIDPLVTVLISLYIMRESWVIVKNSVGILMQSAADLDYSAIQREIEAIPEVRDIHHVHTWMANEETVYFEAHIDVEDCLLSEACAVSERIEGILKKHYGISHVTLQFETGRCAEKSFFKK
jgi:cobalt-zinc-cadmium efflux system protein